MNNWEKMSALADDQLAAEEASAIKMAMQTDPSLKSRYDSILSLKRSLRNNLPTHDSPETLALCLDRIREIDRVGKTENVVHKFRYAIASVLAVAIISAATLNRLPSDEFDRSALAQTLSASVAGGGKTVKQQGPAADWLRNNLDNFDEVGLRPMQTDTIEISGKPIGRYFYQDGDGKRFILLNIPGVIDCGGAAIPGYGKMRHVVIDGVNALVWTEDSRSFVFTGNASVPELLSHLR
jgi:anti-sigma factor RsiW